jgi:sulfite reductase (NADPH) flavoprotein alpha-component
MTQLDIPATRFDFLDLLQQYPVKNAAQFKEVLQILNPQSPRLYTVASSPIAHTDEVHITVARDTFWVDTIKKYGVCSDFLSQIEVSSTLDFFVQKNKRFKLPSTDKDIIMIGPGTGIAAFRSFLAERDANGATGRNWLFFGEQYFATDFLYQTELQNWVATGVLTKLNVAFSRDQPKKIYVQDRMLENAEALFEWLEAGASVFVCGKKDPMSTDVENTLLQIIEQEGQQSTAEAKAYLDLLKEQHRYHKDVY